jgi:hypothetical protein
MLLKLNWNPKYVIFLLSRGGVGRPPFLDLSLHLLYKYVRLIAYLLFYVPLKNFSHKPMLGAQGQGSLPCHTCCDTGEFFRSRPKDRPIQSPLTTHKGMWITVSHMLWHGPQFFRSRPKDRPIQSSLTTHKGMWRIYSNPDPHGPIRQKNFNLPCTIH